MTIWDVTNLTLQAVTPNDVQKIRRLMTARSDGTYLVPESVVKLWRDTSEGGREEVKKLWLQVGCDKD